MEERPPSEPIANSSLTRDSTILHLNAKTLDGLLDDSIDQVLGDLLGTKAKEAIYDYLERNYSIAREDIPKNIEKFFTLTEKMFGKGSKTIARCIMKRLCEQLGWKFEDIQGFEFSDYLEAVRARIARELVKNAKASMFDRQQ